MKTYEEYSMIHSKKSLNDIRYRLDESKAEIFTDAFRDAVQEFDKKLKEVNDTPSSSDEYELVARSAYEASLVASKILAIERYISRGTMVPFMSGPGGETIKKEILEFIDDPLVNIYENIDKIKDSHIIAALLELRASMDKIDFDNWFVGAIGEYSFEEDFGSDLNTAIEFLRKGRDEFELFDRVNQSKTISLLGEDPKIIEAITSPSKA